MSYMLVCIYDMCACVLNCLSYVRLFVTLQTVARQAALSVGFFRQEYWSELPGPPSRDIPHPGIEPLSLTSLALAERFFTTCTTRAAHEYPIGSDWNEMIVKSSMHKYWIQTCEMRFS